MSSELGNWLMWGKKLPSPLVPEGVLENTTDYMISFIQSNQKRSKFIETKSRLVMAFVSLVVPKESVEVLSGVEC